uniref:ERVV2 protein n=1 Tax=Nothobranchius furzeri TaxID=105023 RepID=A0A8C6LC43_NOTFU
RESLMQHMIEVWWSLENITTVLSDMTSLLAQDPEKQAMRTMLMQHQLALDTLFAFEGGLCAKFGEHCCTYVPSSRDNWTLIHDRV